MSDLHHIPPRASGAGHGASEDQYENERKRKRREICKASRDRVQKDKGNLKNRIDALKAEIAEEEMTNRSFAQEERMMIEKLKLLKTRKTELQGEFADKEKEVANQNMKLEELSKDPNLGPQLGFHSLEFEMLRDELAVLTHITNWDDWGSEKSELENKVTKLEMEKIKLNTQWHVLAEKTIHDWKQGHPSGH